MDQARKVAQNYPFVIVMIYEIGKKDPAIGNFGTR
jgi:hypothetical protein